MWCAIGITFKRDGRHGDNRKFRKPLFKGVILRLAFGQADPPPVIVDHDADMVRIFKRRCATIECGVIEIPFRRSDLPNDLRKLTPVFVVARPAPFRGEVKLVPPLKFSL